MARPVIALIALIASLSGAWGQTTLLNGGAWTAGHVPQYVGTSQNQFSQPVVMDGGSAAGGAVGVNAGEMGIVARGPVSSTPPYVGLGTGPNGEIFCLYDGPIDAAAGYHYVCLTPNASNGSQSGPMISVGYGGAASPLPLSFKINGVAVNPVTCSAGSPTSSFAATNGIVTHC